ncbi:hypothetical protein O9K51_11264 [Purpureocillium lavendulum]|uniref:Kinesin light chain n=1 Tax=Purpureocillium lavendulum TaxID=1247861 RepID=A0AB34FC75_9HYPO|nr:hypothetical protein O9K51_11264 [Purpureocillium lavendulum]
MFGEKHPYTLMTMNNLAQVLLHQGRCFEAEEMHRETLQKRQTLLGDEHPDTVWSMANLALALILVGKHNEAEAMNHDTIKLLALAMQGKYQRAERVNRETLALHQEVLGYKHSCTLTSMNNLAVVLLMEGKYEDAEALNHETLELRQEVFGSSSDPPDVFSTISQGTVTYCINDPPARADLYRMVTNRLLATFDRKHVVVCYDAKMIVGYDTDTDGEWGMFPSTQTLEKMCTSTTKCEGIDTEAVWLFINLVTPKVFFTATTMLSGVFTSPFQLLYLCNLIKNYGVSDISNDMSQCLYDTMLNDTAMFGDGAGGSGRHVALVLQSENLRLPIMSC